MSQVSFPLFKNEWECFPVAANSKTVRLSPILSFHTLYSIISLTCICWSVPGPDLGWLLFSYGYPIQSYGFKRHLDSDNSQKYMSSPNLSPKLQIHTTYRLLENSISCIWTFPCLNLRSRPSSPLSGPNVVFSSSVKDNYFFGCSSLKPKKLLAFLFLTPHCIPSDLVVSLFNIFAKYSLKPSH